MTETRAANGGSSSPVTGGYEPDVPITVSPILDWPPRPAATLKHIASMMLPQGMIWVGIAAVAWNFFTPSMERMATLSPRWILEIYVRNVVMFSLVAGTLHMVLYARRAQEQRYKYQRQWLSTTNREFLWNHQTRDNVFWCLVSGCSVWTAYEALTMWFYANGWIPQVEWDSAWLYLSFLTVFTSLWSVTHFYFIHRVLHTRWVYDHVHYLHHRNVNPGPWSGLSMHPVEHMMYLSMFLLWWVVPAHPFILILTLSSNSIATAVTHSGFERYEFAKRNGPSMKGADYFHHLHHRYFECNYGNRPVPLDRLFGTFHDGTPEAHARMRERMKARRRARTKA
ncbi:MAG: sterol desaturase family protein [Acidimicrobiaceae bacterium]|nr:sterol desaturase family protein [Acidimicrobiaceae bacterium]MYH00737.1 sterol desaturase family protein [Acidimicrobiaceae bacterium]MYL03945.1 sterol desaturase family protein [Acidimicrobiaceae bacterium]